MGYGESSGATGCVGAEHAFSGIRHHVSPQVW